MQRVCNDAHTASTGGGVMENPFEDISSWEKYADMDADQKVTEDAKDKQLRADKEAAWNIRFDQDMQ
jgi:hypothetical protein